MIWTGANDGPFHVTRDNGKTWTNVTPKDLPTGRPRAVDRRVAASPRLGVLRGAIATCSATTQPYIYRTDDYGKTWTRLTDGKNGIPADWPTRVVREDPDREGLLYAGTEFGMFISFDNGAHWQPFQLNLPNVPITDIKVHQQGSGRRDAGARVLDPRQPDAAAPDRRRRRRPPRSMLFKPRDGYRTRVGAAARPDGRLLPAGGAGAVRSRSRSSTRRGRW